MKKKENVLVKRRRTKIVRDVARVITRLYLPGNITKIHNIVNRVLQIDESECEKLFREVSLKFSDRHRDIETLFLANFNYISDIIVVKKSLSFKRKLLIGAYFTMEYSIESAAIFNPSMVLHPDQSGLSPGTKRFIMSLRATGEGHISSLVFRSGIIDKDSSLIFDSLSDYVATPETTLDRYYDKHLFTLKLKDMKSCNQTSETILKTISPRFTFQELTKRIDNIYPFLKENNRDETIEDIYWLANSNYLKRFSSETKLSERVIFPVSEHENRGIEDARFVRFRDDQDDIIYYATYTAYNGIHILPHLLETKDFLDFKITTLNGKAAQNKGMALFPRKINDKYAMLARVDGENNYIIFSDNLHFWDDARLIHQPKYTWEFVQVGNCGSPIETEYGWLVLTHGVGAMRQYSISAILLDLHDPTKVVKRLEKPLLIPTESEREGYVPNVVYSCGSIIHNDTLVIPYAMSDITSGVANVNLKELIHTMKYQ